MKRWTALVVLLWGMTVATAADDSSCEVQFDPATRYTVELSANRPVGEASIRENAIVWHPQRQRYYLIADVIPLDNPHHPNTYDTELHLWSSTDLSAWTYHGVAVPKGRPGRSYDGYGVASPAGMVYHDGRLYVAFSARRTARYDQRDIGLAWSEQDPEQLPWTKIDRPISAIANSEDDDAALVVRPGDDRIHLYHRRTGEGGYRIVHTSSSTPNDPDTWLPAEPVCARPNTVRAQELTAAIACGSDVHLFIIEHMSAGGIRIAHMRSDDPDGPFVAAAADRYLSRHQQPAALAYSGHISVIQKNHQIVGYFWTVPQDGPRYGLQGHPVLPDDLNQTPLMLNSFGGDHDPSNHTAAGVVGQCGLRRGGDICSTFARGSSGGARG